MDMTKLAEWYNAQERRPTVRQVARLLGCSPSTAHSRLLEAQAAGLIERRTLADRWAK